MIRVLTKEDYIVSDWNGGRTIQLAIAPENAVYAERDFLWRISSATVELAESDYTSLPDYDRLIMPLNGEMILSHDGSEEIDVTPLEVHGFDGAASTHCRGVCTDFNLMMRKGRAAGRMKAIRLEKGSRWQLTPASEKESLLLYLVKGGAVLISGEQRYPVREGQSLFLSGETGSFELKTNEGAVLAEAAAWEN